MIPEISLDAARNERWDIIIAGTSFSAMFFLLGLPEHLRVLMIEKGGYIPHADQVDQMYNPGRETFARGPKDKAKPWLAHSTFGGNSNCWWGNTPRQLPNDFRMQSLYGIGEDWPISYEELEPYYGRVEAIMEISGEAADHITPRSTPYPFPGHIPTRTDRQLRAMSDLWTATPCARSNGGRRAQCCATGACNLCPVDAKFTVLNSLDLFLRRNVSILLNTEVRAVNIEAGRVTGLVVQNGNRDIPLNGDHVALGTNAIFNTAILLRSGLTHPALGAYLNEQLGHYVRLDAPDLGYFGGTSITGLGYALYDGPHRADYAGALLEIVNAPFSLRTDIGRWTECAKIKIVVEDLPQMNNRVYLENDEPVIEWTGYSDYCTRGIEAALDALPSLFDKVENMTSLSPPASEAHIQGTHRMGTDPEESVTDDYLRLHGIGDLHILGSGAFPTSPPANPTLTLSALALRAAEAVI